LPQKTTKDNTIAQYHVLCFIIAVKPFSNTRRKCVKKKEKKEGAENE
jgi:hypothetical protein